MKISIRLMCFALVIISVFGIFSCEQKSTSDSLKGTAEFSLNLQDEINPTKSGISSDSGIISYQLMVSVEDMNGNPVLTDEMIPVYSFGTGFISEKIEIKTGEYLLTKFLVINPSGEVILASPVEGSPLAYLVNNPLPINFNIYPDQVTKIVPEVLPAGDHNPGEFGYASFGIHIVKPLNFWTVCFLDNPLIMAPIQFTSARLTIYANDGWHYTFLLEPTINHLLIRGGSEFYTFILEKEGFPVQTMNFSAFQLIGATEENPLVLKIPWGSQFETLVLQPGPDAGKDAMISNLQPDINFGDHKYFEATFLSEPVLTVMRSNRSLIWFDMNSLPKSAVIQKVVLQLFCDIPVPLDSTVTVNSNGTSPVFIGGVLQQIITPWEESKVTWNTQPATTEANQVLISPFILNGNFIEVNVTSLFKPSAEMASPNYGMLFRLYPNDGFPGFRFASSDFSVPNMRPKLIIHYTTVI
jgi:hypothetical protein